MPSKRWLIGKFFDSDSELEKDLNPPQLKILKEFSFQFSSTQKNASSLYVYLLVTNVVEKHDFSKKNAKNKISEEQRSVLYF